MNPVPLADEYFKETWADPARRLLAERRRAVQAEASLLSKARALLGCSTAKLTPRHDRIAPKSLHDAATRSHPVGSGIAPVQMDPVTSLDPPLWSKGGRAERAEERDSAARRLQGGWRRKAAVGDAERKRKQRAHDQLAIDVAIGEERAADTEPLLLRLPRTQPLAAPAPAPAPAVGEVHAAALAQAVGEEQAAQAAEAERLMRMREALEALVEEAVAAGAVAEAASVVLAEAVPEGISELGAALKEARLEAQLGEADEEKQDARERMRALEERLAWLWALTGTHAT